EDAQAAITAGKLHPFKCPVLGQDGKPVECKGGTHLDDGQILGMNFYVKGIDDKFPAKYPRLTRARSGHTTGAGVLLPGHSGTARKAGPGIESGLHHIVW